ncbi:ribbon-helix-helix domain-containing protein [Azospirillum sp. YIM DDC1]|uniref:Ribbon-helix-helix domain-containing protein n=1 Tax=Azospirillum aestuarii TaxID=2802052 RepID=A0ABS1I6L8_9PROT|nr:ribbon-helix-helix domain-containing protein [Azospirillum aestuarii]
MHYLQRNVQSTKPAEPVLSSVEPYFQISMKDIADREGVPLRDLVDCIERRCLIRSARGKGFRRNPLASAIRAFVVTYFRRAAQETSTVVGHEGQGNVLVDHALDDAFPICSEPVSDPGMGGNVRGKPQ